MMVGCLLLEAAAAWFCVFSMLYQVRWQGRAATLVALLVLTTVLVIWTLTRVVIFSRVRLDENGVYPNRKGAPIYVQWQDSLIARRGYLLLIKRGDDVAEINMASFCRQRPLRDFINGKFPSRG
jgi:hypothetical protein